MVGIRCRAGASSHDQPQNPTMSNPIYHHQIPTTKPKNPQCLTQTTTIILTDSTRPTPKFNNVKAKLPPSEPIHKTLQKKPHRTDAMRPIMCLFISVGIYPMVAAAGKSGFNYYKMSMPNHQAQPSRWCLSYLYKPILNLFPATCLVFLGYPFSVR